VSIFKKYITPIAVTQATIEIHLGEPRLSAECINPVAMTQATPDNYLEGLDYLQSLCINPVAVTQATSDNHLRGPRLSAECLNPWYRRDPGIPRFRFLW
jgi:hypothetical protein